MSTKLFPRLLGVLAIFAVMAALFWAIVHFAFGTQDALNAALVERLDGDPARVQAYLDELAGTLLTAGIAGLLAAAVLACLWLVLIDRSPPYGDKSARSKRGSWAGLLILALLILVALFWFLVIGAPIAETLASGLSLNATLAAVALAVIGYWLATALFAPASTKVAIPGGTMFGG